MAHIWSAQQQAIFGWFAKPTAQRNLIVRARAGTGKTTTILEAITRAPESAILVAAFNKRIQEELKGRLTTDRAQALTLHSIGNTAVRRYWSRINVEQKRGARAAALAERICGVAAPDPIKALVAKLCTKGREMQPWVAENPTTYPLLEDVALQFDLVPDDGWVKDGFDLAWICAHAAAAMKLAKDEKPTSTGIDYADMLFLPLVNRWLRPMFGVGVIDEGQDMTRVQLELALGVIDPDGRVAVVGDDRQAVYGFRGADSEALDRLKLDLKASELGLTTTYRCGKAIVDYARTIVPDFRAGADNPEGVISTIRTDGLPAVVRPGDFVLSRKNAPLVSLALSLIRKGVRTKIEGRDIGAGLKAIVWRLATGRAKNSIPAWLEKLENWRDKEVKRAEAANADGKVEETLDKYEMLGALADGVAGISELLARVDHVCPPLKPGANEQVEDAKDRATMVICSSVHRAKGLEADRVFVLKNTLNPPLPCKHCHKRPGFWHDRGGCETYEVDSLKQQEERNIEYVAVTRAKHELVWVLGDVARRA